SKPPLSDTAMLIITIISVNDAPIANTDHYALTEDAIDANYIVLSNDIDVEGDQLSVSIISGPKNGTATVNANKTIKYKPNSNFSGADTLIYQVCDAGTPPLCDTAML